MTDPGLSFNLLALLFLAHMSIPRAQVHTRKFFALSYYNPASGRYAIGPDDAKLIFFFIVLFTGLRASAMEYMLAPLGKLAGLTKRKDLTRFSEQAWMLIYYSVFWTMGMVRIPAFWCMFGACRSWSCLAIPDGLLLLALPVAGGRQGRPSRELERRRAGRGLGG